MRSQKEKTQQPPSSDKQKLVSKRVRWLSTGFVLLALVVVFFPTIIGRTGIRDRLINRVIAAPNLSASTQGASLGWFSPLSVDGLRIDGKQKRFRVEVESVAADRSWPRLLTSSPDLGKISVERPQVWLKFPLGEPGAISPILSPTFSAAISDAALLVQHDQSDDPFIKIDGVDLTVHLRDSEQGMHLAVDPFDVYKRAELTPESCGRLLGLITPSLKDAAEIEGAFSLSLAKLNVPIGISEAQMMQRMEVQGELALHQVSIATENELLQTLAKIVADVHQKPAPAQTRVVKDAVIQFKMQDGRLHHEGLRFGFPDIDPNLVIKAYGSVGVDRSLDAYFEVPRLDHEKHEQRDPVLCHVTGTVSNPQLSAKDASLVVRIPNRAEPLIDVDGVDFTARIEETPNARLISFDPMIVLSQKKLDRQLASTLLHLLDPELQHSPQLDGEISLSVESLRIPIGVPDEKWVRSLELDGTLVIHEATSLAETPIRQAIIKLLADLYEKQPTESVRIAHNAEVEIHLRNGRFHFEGLHAGFPDIDPKLDVAIQGSIGLDETLDIHLEVPRLDADKRKEHGPVRCHLTGTVSAPQLSAQNASLVIHLPGRTEPLIDVDGVDLTVRVDEWQGRRVISVDPVELLRRAEISRQLATGLLHLVDPELQYSPQIVGQVSLSVDTLRIPVGVPDEQWMASLEAQGNLKIHQAASLVQSPLRMAVAKLLADLYSIRPGEAVRVIHDADVNFALRQSRFHFNGLRFGFPDIDPKLQIDVKGSVGLDQTLDLHLQLPRLDAEKRREKGFITCRITGTVGNPQLAVADASLVVRLPGHEHPLLDVDAIDLDMEIQFEADTPVLKLAPMKVFDRRQLTTQRGEEWLRLIAPAVAEVAGVKGEFSLSIDAMRIPLSGTKEQILRSTELSGQLQLHDVTTTVETPLLTVMLKILADQYGKTPSETVRVAKDAEIQFEFREGRLFQEGFQIGFPELSADLLCRASGSVGLDRSLDLILEVPAILAGKRNEEADVIRFKVTGTIDEPNVVEIEN